MKTNKEIFCEMQANTMTGRRLRLLQFLNPEDEKNSLRGVSEMKLDLIEFLMLKFKFSEIPQLKTGKVQYSLVCYSVVTSDSAET